MDLEALRLVIKIADTGSMAAAARHLGLSRSGASQRLQALEQALGATLFQRTTRAITLTPDGHHLLERARRLVADADDLATVFVEDARLRGRVRVDVPIPTARNLVLPRLPEFLALHPELQVELSTSDRRIDLVREGCDCVLRIGGLGDGSLTAMRLGHLAMITCASPTYLERHGVPRDLDTLPDHFVVHYTQTLGEGAPSLEVMVGEQIVDCPMRHWVAVNGIDAYRAAGQAGLGLIQVPRYSIEPDLAAGILVEVLAEHPPPPMAVSIVHPYGRNAPRRVRAVMRWLASLMAPHLEHRPA